MRIVSSHTYAEAISFQNLLQAWQEFRIGKTKRRDVITFEKKLRESLGNLHKDLRLKKYKHAPYSSFFIYDPKVRHISKACVRDRVVHHALFKVLTPIFEPTFILDSYSCRVGFGTHKGFQKLVAYARKVSKNYTQDCWALKCDVKKFFDSVNHEILLEIMRKRIQNEDLFWLVKEVVGSFQIERERERGLPIGNLTSQLFANIYLNELDQFVKHTLKVKYYVRYADDFMLVNRDRKLLEKCLVDLSSFLENKLLLKLHPNKVHLRKLSWGIDFVGYIALPHHQTIRTKTKRRLFKKVKWKVKEYRDGQIKPTALNQSIQSYMGILRHAKTYRLKQKLIKEINLELAKKKP
ncbi:MAG: group II intron reverse transcriptase domain-containing protein [Candidatus Blackburnbacteria bacterium]|nr:group II intron reverse transcriptase domain-containing protein [Candidatus Blackburnbacteria bacterium]